MEIALYRSENKKIRTNKWCLDVISVSMDAMMREKWLGFKGGSQDSQRGYVDVISVSMDRMWVNCWGYVVLGFYGCSQDSQNFWGCHDQCFDVCNNVGKIVGIPILVVLRTHKMVL